MKFYLSIGILVLGLINMSSGQQTDYRGK